MDITLHFTRAHKADDPYAFRLGAQEYQLHREPGDVSTARLDWNDELLDYRRGPHESPL